MYHHQYALIHLSTERYTRSRTCTMREHDTPIYFQEGKDLTLCGKLDRRNFTAGIGDPKTCLSTDSLFRTKDKRCYSKKFLKEFAKAGKPVLLKSLS